LTYFTLVLGLAALLLSTSLLSLNITQTSELMRRYECGFEPIGVSHIPFCMKFFLLAIIFVVFDVEISFLVPALYSSATILSFVFFLIVGLLYEYAYGGLS